MKSTSKKLIHLLPLAAVALVAGLHLSQDASEAFVVIARADSSTEYDFSSPLGSAPFPANTPTLVHTAAARWSQPATGVPFSFINFVGQIGPVRMTVGGANLGALGFPDVPGVNSLYFNSGYLVSSTLRLNTTWTWNTSCTMNQALKKVDVMTIVLHEFGHSVSLNHDQTHPEAVMWPADVCKQTLRADDKAGIDYLY